MVTLRVGLGCLLPAESFGLRGLPLLLLPAPPPPLLLFLVCSPLAVAPPVRLHLLPAVRLPAAAHTHEAAGCLVRAHVDVQQPPGRQLQGTQEAEQPVLPGRRPAVVSGRGLDGRPGGAARRSSG